MSKFLWSEHKYLWLYFSSPITNENFEAIFLLSFLNFHDVRKRCLLLLTWHHTWGLLYHSSSTINVHFLIITYNNVTFYNCINVTVPVVICFCLFKKLFLQIRFIPYVLQLQQSQIQKKAFIIEPVATVWYLFKYQRQNYFIRGSRDLHVTFELDFCQLIRYIGNVCVCLNEMLFLL